MFSESLAVVASLIGTLERLGTRYVIGGSFASSLYGIPRATQDVDIVADLKESDAQSFAEQLTGDFYVDLDMITDAIRLGRPFNVIHLETMFKADIFAMEDEPWSREEMARAHTEQLIGPDGPFRVRFASPEDTLIHKLRWYRSGGESSDRQWADILGVLRVQGAGLDVAYLDRWAAHFEIEDLLMRARVHG